MKNELVKPIVRVGNSAGVLLPREWLNGTARVELLKKPLNLNKEILEILEPYLEDTLGVYLTGSYARGEETERSDIDVLVITNKTNKQIKNGKYNIILILKDNLEETLNNNILPILPMLIEAKPIMNAELTKGYRDTPLTKKNMAYYIETTKSALGVNKAIIESDKELSKGCSDAVAYSLILRLRSYYIIDCIINGKKWNNKELIGLIKSVSGSEAAYEGYIRGKDKKKQTQELPTEEAEKIYIYVERGIKKHEEWLARKK